MVNKQRVSKRKEDQCIYINTPQPCLDKRISNTLHFQAGWADLDVDNDQNGKGLESALSFSNH